MRSMRAATTSSSPTRPGTSTTTGTHPELKKAKLAWFTDFVGYVPMPANGEHEAFLTTHYNAEMIEHVERHPGVRDRAIFVGSPEDIVSMSFGKDLPAMRDWVPKHFDFAGYIIGEPPHT